MDNVKAGARRSRFLQVERLYRSGFTLAQIGAQLEPPITPQRTGQLLREGAQLGLYLMPEMHGARLQRNERRLTDLEVRAALMGTQRKEQAAELLGISKAALDTRFGHVLRGVQQERRMERLRKAVMDEYAALVHRLGYHPTTTGMPRPLVARIQRRFRSMRRFYAATGVIPQDRRRR